ncbi:14833_t:CDS:2, partial [Racocetra persica]
PVLEFDLMGPLAEILSTNYLYIINEFSEFAYMWFEEFHEKTKTTMCQTIGYILKGQYVIFHVFRHFIYSNLVKEKQKKSVQIKKPHSEYLRNTGCLATIRFCIKKHYLKSSYPLE